MKVKWRQVASVAEALSKEKDAFVLTLDAKPLQAIGPTESLADLVPEVGWFRSGLEGLRSGAVRSWLWLRREEVRAAKGGRGVLWFAKLEGKWLAGVAIVREGTGGRMLVEPEVVV